ncbi:MAG: hypothetical protein AAFS11_04265, partial [Planctomycetota bacterium]
MDSAALVKRVAPLLAVMIALPAAAEPQSVPFTGSDHTGYLAFINVKNWGTESQLLAPSGLPDYPYFFNPDVSGGVWSSIIAEPLSSESVYPIGAGTAVLNTGITDPDFSTRSAGEITYDDAPLAGVGTELVVPEDLTFTIAGESFSSLNSVHNTGGGVGNAGWTYVISIDNPTGAGLTVVDGEPVSLDVSAGVTIQVLFAGQAPLANMYTGTVTFAGDSFLFDIDVTQDTPSPLGLLSDTRLIFNRTGTIDAIAASASCPADTNDDGTVNPAD